MYDILHVTRAQRPTISGKWINRFKVPYSEAPTLSIPSLTRPNARNAQVTLPLDHYY